LAAKQKHTLAGAKAASEVAGPPRKLGIRARRKARRFVLQALYQRRLSGTSETEIEAQFLEDNDMAKVDTVYFHELLMGIPANESDLCDQIKECIDRKMSELDPIELSILLMGAYELMSRLDIPYKVVINEGIELAKVLGATDSYKYVNSILDRLAHQHRQAEMQQP
jgi:N utilization substance protein B